MPNLILTPIEYTFTLSQSQVLKVVDCIGIDYKSSKFSANISINTCDMHMLYILVIPTSKESGSDHEAEILSVLLQVSIYPILRRACPKGIAESNKNAPSAFYGRQYSELWGTLHLQVFHRKVSSGIVLSCNLPPTSGSAG